MSLSLFILTSGKKPNPKICYRLKKLLVWTDGLIIEVPNETYNTQTSTTYKLNKSNTSTPDMQNRNQNTYLHTHFLRQ
jgi:hypothetical protein